MQLQSRSVFFFFWVLDQKTWCWRILLIIGSSDLSLTISETRLAVYSPRLFRAEYCCVRRRRVEEIQEDICSCLFWCESKILHQWRKTVSTSDFRGITRWFGKKLSKSWILSFRIFGATKRLSPQTTVSRSLCLWEIDKITSLLVLIKFFVDRPFRHRRRRCVLSLFSYNCLMPPRFRSHNLLEGRWYNTSWPSLDLQGRSSYCLNRRILKTFGAAPCFWFD